MPVFHIIPTIPYQKKRERVYIKSVTGEDAQLCFMRLEPGEVTDHQHPQEQLGYIFSGQVALTIDGHPQTLGAGDAYYIPKHVRHGFKVLTEQPLEYLEVFSPPKEENRTDT